MKKFQKYIDTFNGKTYHHVGLTSIKGMFGKPIIEIMCVTKFLLPDIPDTLINKMAKFGYTYMGVD